MLSRKALTAFSLLFAWCLVVAGPASAQDPRGSITGPLADATAGVLPGVSVTVKNVETNATSTTVTDSKGYYQVKYLLSGTYSVEAQLEGFKPMIRKSIAVRVGDALRIDFKMELGGVSETIQVTASAPLLDTRTGVTGQVVDSTQIERLPLADGTAYMLTRLAPGLVRLLGPALLASDGQRQPRRHRGQRRPGRQRLHARWCSEPRLA